MFTGNFEKNSGVISAIGKGLASGAAKASFNPLAATAKLKPWNKITGIAHNVGALGKQYAPAAGAAFLAGRATADNKQQSNN